MLTQFHIKLFLFYQNSLARGPKYKGVRVRLRVFPSPRADGLARKAKVFRLFNFQAQPDPTLESYDMTHGKFQSIPQFFVSQIEKPTAKKLKIQKGNEKAKSQTADNITFSR